MWCLREKAGLDGRRGTVEMPAISHHVDNRRASRNQARQRARWRSSQRNTGRSPPLKILVVKALSMLVLGEGVDS